MKRRFSQCLRTARSLYSVPFLIFFTSGLLNAQSQLFTPVNTPDMLAAMPLIKADSILLKAGYCKQNIQAATNNTVRACYVHAATGCTLNNFSLVYINHRDSSLVYTHYNALLFNTEKANIDSKASNKFTVENNNFSYWVVGRIDTTINKEEPMMEVYQHKRTNLFVVFRVLSTYGYEKYEIEVTRYNPLLKKEGDMRYIEVSRL